MNVPTQSVRSASSCWKTLRTLGCLAAACTVASTASAQSYGYAGDFDDSLPGITQTSGLYQPFESPQPEIMPVAAEQDQLLALVDQAIAQTKLRHLDFKVHTPWQILHGLLALREDYTLKNGDQMVNAVEFLSKEARYKGLRWFESTPHGARAQPYNGTPYDFEGHVNQTLSIISMCDLPLTHQFTLDGGKVVTMQDMIRHAQMTINNREEITWTLWLLTHYVDQDAEWVNATGQRWSMETLVRMQTAAPPYNAPCGGCHGLFALAYARNSYLKKHGQLRGAWLEADQKLQQFIAAAQSMQNRDGSFATQFFKARGYSTNFNERITSSGHMIEWLMMALPQSRLNENWIRVGVQTLATDMIRNASQPADCGPLYHSLHALILYRQRVQPTTQPSAPQELASKPAEVPNTNSAATPAQPGVGVATTQPAQPVLEAPATLRPIPARQIPAHPPVVSQDAPMPKSPIRVAEQPEAEGVRKLSARDEQPKGPAPLVNNPVAEAAPAMMPIYLQPQVIPVREQPKSDTVSTEPKVEVAATPAKEEAQKKEPAPQPEPVKTAEAPPLQGPILPMLAEDIERNDQLD